MDDTADTAQVIIRPPLGWGFAVIAGLALNWLVPLAFLPVDLPAGSLGAMMFILALALVAWAIFTITGTGSNVPTNLPTTAIVESGPLSFPKIPSRPDSRDEAESAHHTTRCLHFFSCLGRLSPTCSGRSAGLKSRTSFSGISSILL